MRLHNGLTASIVCALTGAAAYAQPVTLIEAGRVLDVRTGAYANRQGILIEGGRILEIGDFASVRAHAPKDAAAIDLHAATLLPGLIDCHAHLLIATEFRFLGDAEVKAIVDEAHRSKIKVAVHAVTTESIAISIEAGVDSIEHGDEATGDQLTAMRDKGIFLGATEWTRDALLGGYSKALNMTPEFQAAFEAYYKNYAMNSTRRLRSAMKLGVKIAAGSDMWFNYPGKTRGEATVMVLATGLHEEGMPPADQIRAMTLSAAELLGWQDRVGSVEPKKFADLIAVAGDPLLDIGELQRVKFVMKGGRVVRNDFGR